jgi:D-alanyl-D-alanine carboxypeptidase
MKKLTLPLILSGAAIFASSFFIDSNFNKFITNQMATVIGIDINQVMNWQSQRGLNKDLTVGNSGKDVLLLQYAFNKALPNFKSANITGYFGPMTYKAVSDFQKNQGLNINGKLDVETRAALNYLYLKELCPDGQGNVYLDEIVIHINKTNSLPDDYIPDDLINISDGVKTMGIACLKQDVAPYLQKMFDDAGGQHISLAVTSSFRRPEVQSVLYKALLLIKGESVKNRIAEPLHSEHQLGTTVDLTGQSINYLGADDSFDGTQEDMWLRQNAYKYGFVLSYPKDKTLVTGYDYEPWHYRFIGVDIAKQIFDKQISVEEYFNSILHSN